MGSLKKRGPFSLYLLKRMKQEKGDTVLPKVGQPRSRPGLFILKPWNKILTFISTNSASSNGIWGHAVRNYPLPQLATIREAVLFGSERA